MVKYFPCLHLTEILYKYYHAPSLNCICCSIRFTRDVGKLFRIFCTFVGRYMRGLIYSLLTLDLTLITYTDYKFSVTSWYSKFATFVRERDYEKQSIFSMFSFDINLIKIHRHKVLRRFSQE